MCNTTTRFPAYVYATSAIWSFSKTIHNERQTTFPIYITQSASWKKKFRRLTDRVVYEKKNMFLVNGELFLERIPTFISLINIQL